MLWLCEVVFVLCTLVSASNYPYFFFIELVFTTFRNLSVLITSPRGAGTGIACLEGTNPLLLLTDLHPSRSFSGPDSARKQLIATSDMSKSIDGSAVDPNKLRNM